ncbi:hypothetical protein [Chromobacterium vaccinii]|uniref:hypothetical protein n=1 Tax=Chromobacterium vaccinii TaxID=1108595 RepID=UPI001185ED00|nr:hypothetical protein [Chromobacterium vaccinii]
MATEIVSTVLIEDVLIEASPDLEWAPDSQMRTLTDLLRPAIIKLVMSCTSPALMTTTLEQERESLSGNRVAAKAFEVFVKNMSEA